MSRAPRVPRPSRPILLTVLVTVLLAFPMGIVLANHQFSDVPNSNPFHTDIDALVDSGVTAGCGSGKYCPKSVVTREQMAAFLNRLGALAPGKTPVVNAAELQGSLPSVGVEQLTGATASLTPDTVDSFTVTAPGPGTLLVTVSGDFFMDLDSGAATSAIENVTWGICDATDSSAECGGTYRATYYQDADNASSTSHTPGTSRVRAVAVAGGDRTFYLNAETDDASAGFFTWNTFASVVFVPGTGTSVLSIDAASAADGPVDQPSQEGE